MQECINSLDKRPAPNSLFTILIPTWNNLSFLKLCIDSIRKNSTYSHEVIVHINEGIDGSLAWVKEQSDISFTYSENNIGICKALNAGRSFAETEYIVYMNDDMYVCPGWDEAFYEEIKLAGHKYFFFSSTAIEPVASSNCAIEKNFGRDVASFDEQKLLSEYALLNKEDWLGATWPPNVVHKDLWDLVGGYSIEFSPGMYSDPDFSMKLWLAGVRLFKGISKSRVYHFGSISTNRMKKNKGYYTFIHKWGFTSSTLTNKILRRGEKFDGPLNEFEPSVSLQTKNFFKRFQSLFVKTT